MTKNQVLSLKPGDKVLVCGPHLHGEIRVVERLFVSTGRFIYGVKMAEDDPYLYRPQEIEHYKE